MAATILRLHHINEVRLIGRLTRDPELKVTSKGQAVCRLDLAVNRRYKDSMGEWKDDTSFIPVVVWRETAQRCSERLKKGSPVYVEGRLRSRNWETKEGQKRTSIEVDSRTVQFLAKMEGEQELEAEVPASEPPVTSSGIERAPSASQSADDEIPF